MIKPGNYFLHKQSPVSYAIFLFPKDALQRKEKQGIAIQISRLWPSPSTERSEFQKCYTMKIKGHLNLLTVYKQAYSIIAVEISWTAVWCFNWDFIRPDTQASGDKVFGLSCSHHITALFPAFLHEVASLGDNTVSWNCHLGYRQK